MILTFKGECLKKGASGCLKNTDFCHEWRRDYCDEKV